LNEKKIIQKTVFISKINIKWFVLILIICHTNVKLLMSIKVAGKLI